MRSGEKPSPLRCLLPFVGHVEATLTFVAPLLDAIGYHARPKNTPTVEEIKADMMAFVRKEELLRKLYASHAGMVRGWTPEQIEAALAGGDK
jgi:hypothetical protein